MFRAKEPGKQCPATISTCPAVRTDHRRVWAWLRDSWLLLGWGVGSGSRGDGANFREGPAADMAAPEPPAKHEQLCASLPFTLEDTAGKTGINVRKAGATCKLSLNLISRWHSALWQQEVGLEHGGAGRGLAGTRGHSSRQVQRGELCLMGQPACAQGVRPLLSPRTSVQNYSKGRE